MPSPRLARPLSRAPRRPLHQSNVPPTSLAAPHASSFVPLTCIPPPPRWPSRNHASLAPRPRLYIPPIRTFPASPTSCAQGSHLADLVLWMARLNDNTADNSAWRLRTLHQPRSYHTVACVPLALYARSMASFEVTIGRGARRHCLQSACAG